jgi:hypothetical protein
MHRVVWQLQKHARVRRVFGAVFLIKSQLDFEVLSGTLGLE